MPGPVTSVPNLISVTPTVTASSAYSSGNVVGGLQAIATGLPPNSTVILTDIVLNVKSTQTGQFDVLFFNAYPSGSTITDKTALAVVAADSPKTQGAFSLVTYISSGTPTVYQISTLSTCLSVDANGTLWMAVVTRGTPTFTAVSDVNVILKVVQ